MSILKIAGILSKLEKNDTQDVLNLILFLVEYKEKKKDEKLSLAKKVDLEEQLIFRIHKLEGILIRLGIDLATFKEGEVGSGEEGGDDGQ